ncbi:MAG: hypothetical protein ACRCT6_03230 [Notoacmeibacter sp.]
MKTYTKAERKWLDEVAIKLGCAWISSGRETAPPATGFYAYNDAESWLAESIERYGPLEQEQTEQGVDLTFDDAIEVVESYLDYGGGYRKDVDNKIYYHGISTVLKALEAAKKRSLEK